MKSGNTNVKHNKHFMKYKFEKFKENHEHNFGRIVENNNL